VVDLRQAADADPTFPAVLFVHQGTAEDSAAFFSKLDPKARAIADTERAFYSALGLGRGKLSQLFGPEVFVCGFRAMRKGHGVGRPVGDPLVMPGFFLVEHGDTVTWEHVSRHAGDHPDLSRIPRGVPPAQTSTP
jgi:hypothetical protein